MPPIPNLGEPETTIDIIQPLKKKHPTKLANDRLEKTRHQNEDVHSGKLT